MPNLTSCLIVLALLLPMTAYAGQYDTQTFSVDGRSWELTVPAGYRLELLAEMEKPRMLVFAPDGALIVGSLAANIYRVPPPYDKAVVHAKLRGGSNHGVAMRGGTLWVAQNGGVYKMPYRLKKFPHTLKDFTRVADLPARNGGHFTRTIKVGPDSKIYVSLGISGNCSDEYIGAGYGFEDRRGGILRLRESVRSKNTREAKANPNKDGAARWETYASGLRNPVGFGWHPASGVMYASNNGPDHLGYERPAEYFSRIEQGSFHGMPWFWFNGGEMERDRCIKSKPPRNDAVLPSVTFPARSAPMDVAFVPDGGTNKDWTHNAVVALHGSWATRPAGGFFGDRATRRPPRIDIVHFVNRRAVKTSPLVEGFQNAAGARLARPTGLAFGPDGALYFTSDGGVIEGLFRLSRKAEN